MGQKPAVDKGELKAGKTEFRIQETSGTFGRFQLAGNYIVLQDDVYGTFVIDKISWPAKVSNDGLSGYTAKAHASDENGAEYNVLIPMSWVEAISLRRILKENPALNSTKVVEKAGNEGFIAEELKRKYDIEFESFIYGKKLKEVGDYLKCYLTPFGYTNMLTVLNSVGKFLA
jgi:hypothetical protein